MSAIGRHCAGGAAPDVEPGAPPDTPLPDAEGVPDDRATSIGWHATAASASSNASRTTPIYTCDAGRGGGRAFRARRVVPLGAARDPPRGPGSPAPPPPSPPSP